MPAVFRSSDVDWQHYDVRAGTRAEFFIGLRWFQDDPSGFFRSLTHGRWACIPLSVLGGFVCWQWASRMYGPQSGLMACTVWCFCPNILAHGQLITPDVGATALGITAAFGFWQWLRLPNWPRALLAGLLMGFAELTKTTWIILFALWPAIWLVWRYSERGILLRGEWLCQLRQLIVILLMSLCIINAGYGFDGSLKQLGRFSFISRTLGGESQGTSRDGANCFAGTWLGTVRMPLPEDYVLGIDFAKQLCEQKMWSYLAGQWREGGWWYFYLYALAIKVPLGTWLLLALAAVVTLFNRTYRVGWPHELVLLLPIATILLLISSQTGFNHHLRYVLPIFPFAFIWVSKLARSYENRRWFLASLVGLGLLWSVGSSLRVYPHSLSYFNELVGGPTRGHWHLGGTIYSSNIDWGQDLLFLKQWLDGHPEAEPLGLATEVVYEPRLLGISHTGVPRGPRRGVTTAAHDGQAGGPQPGWFAVSVNLLHSRSGEYSYFLMREPTAMAGYSIYIYHVALEEANRLRRQLGLEELAAPSQDTGSVDNASAS